MLDTHLTAHSDSRTLNTRHCFMVHHVHTEWHRSHLTLGTTCYNIGYEVIFFATPCISEDFFATHDAVRGDRNYGRARIVYMPYFNATACVFSRQSKPLCSLFRVAWYLKLKRADACILKLLSVCKVYHSSCLFSHFRCILACFRRLPDKAAPSWSH